MGGASGHMPHPFDLKMVKSGAGLINLFKSIQTMFNENDISEDVNVKIDGSNLSLKLVGKQFAVDRGTQKPIDVEGITIDRIHERYDPSYQVYSDIEKLLTILNSAYSDILPEIKALNLETNSIFLNTEFVSKTNVVDYDYDFIAIHGVSRFYEKYKKVKGGSYIKTRPGLYNPQGRNKAVSLEIDYDESALESLVNKLGKHAEKYGMKVFGPIPARLGKKADITNALNTKLKIKTDVRTEFINKSNGKTLEQWLQNIASLPANYSVKEKRYDTLVTTIDGRKINPYHKKTYYQVIEDNVCLSEIASNEESHDSLAAGIAILHATRIVGQSLLDSLTSEIGNVSNHEGVVIRSPKFSLLPFKITGEYLVKGMFGYIAKDLASRK